MSTISLITATPATGMLGKVFARIGAAFAARHAAVAFAGMSERELQDIGWGHADRIAQTPALTETPQERQARAAAVAAWYGRVAA